MSAKRPVDIALFGATGFTGSLIVAYLAYNYPTLNITLVGRDKIRHNALASRHRNANFDVLRPDGLNLRTARFIPSGSYFPTGTGALQISV
ncbi:hypothetical protein FOZ63_000371 [Perkinsus olseni]|uniref:Saccharopine dehydrogenase NADP binding domain-containing protein n=1 Tax=Perkinsus olseni TaxID=32597 RepID=A0A7J6Q9I7_PEROL|nr:hypothetical protein FOZ63_000371 [Perkinsus olseni]KAF4704852.1 hypothetical protein FOZ62_024704 [Perkinsus olseni]